MAMMMEKRGVITFCTLLVHTAIGKYPGEEHHEVGSLEGDVQNWAVLIENYILQVRDIYYLLYRWRVDWTNQ